MGGGELIEVGQRRKFVKDGETLDGEIIEVAGRRLGDDSTDTGWVKFKLADESMELVKPSAIPFD